MRELDLDSVNVTDAKDKFVDVVKKVIATQTTAPPSKPDDEEEEDEPNHDEHDTKNDLVVRVTMDPMPSTPAPPPTVTASPVMPGSQGSVRGSASSEANTKIAVDDKPGGSHSTGVIIGVAVVFCLAVVAIAVFVVRRRKVKEGTRAKSLSTTQDGGQPSTRYGNNATVLDDTTANYSHMPNTKDLAIHSTQSRMKRLKSSSSSLADDAEITALRIPMEKIELGQLLSRGGFGEVFRGTYKGQPVAVKRLLPERRKDLRQIDGFLAEAKMMGTLDHERIVQFIGVAWDSLAEVCVVSEFMEGGDLRSVLSRWETSERRIHGFDHDKIKIALHVAHAMTYLHSMQPVILHRDLKSKNILLTHDLDAKLTDFGVSRERIDATMTAGVGSSLWMAPEVMMGERYDDKADVFSYGVVLSELDTHLHPYSHATEPGTGRKIPDTAILQMVTMGRLTVEFTGGADPDLVALGRDCVAVDPKDRPTAGEVLHRVHQVWRSCVSL